MNDVDRIHGELGSLISTIYAQGGPSDIVAMEAFAAKALLLAAASYFERRISELLLQVAAESGAKPVCVNFIQHQAIERRYHSMFEWNRNNINKFFALFGEQTRVRLSEKSKEPDIANAIRDFLFLGSTRNLLVHNNYAAYSLESTYSEIWEKFCSAERLIAWLSMELRHEFELAQDAA